MHFKGNIFLVIQAFPELGPDPRRFQKWTLRSYLRVEDKPG